MRLCHIVDATAGDEHIAHDGAYDLFDLVGPPDLIGQELAKYLAVADLYSGVCPSAIDAGQDVYLRLTIKVWGMSDALTKEGE